MNTLEQRIQKLEDTAALKTIVDHFSNLADKKELATQMLLFTQDAVVETYFEGELFAAMKGREEILATFTNFTQNFDTMYHMNGQFTAHINGDTATADHYALVVLVNTVEGQKHRNTNGVIYKDEYVRQNGEWLISKRVANFTWRDNQVIQLS
ncbi:MAG: hypothetical protein H6R05_763 [Burkholderiaceae bacterium]|nr:hypothetical protein [Burkholderiaceae bacterium]